MSKGSAETAILGITLLAVAILMLAGALFLADTKPPVSTTDPLPAGKLLVREASCEPARSEYGDREYQCRLVVLTSDSTPVFKLQQIMVEDDPDAHKKEGTDAEQ